MKLLDKISANMTSGEMQTDTYCSIKSLQDDAKPILIYGAGNGFITFSVFILENYKLNIMGVVDQKFEAKGLYHGLKQIPPASLSPADAHKTPPRVIITIGKTKYHKDIIHYLNSLGYYDIIIATEIFEYHTHYTPRTILQEGKSYFHRHEEQIDFGYGLFEDIESQIVYESYLRNYVDQAPCSIPSQPLSDQYFQDDIPLSKGFSRTINCGAYVGDTVRRLISKVGKVEALACFEPEESNYHLLESYLEKNSNNIADELFHFPNGVFNKKAQLFFAGGNQFNSNLSKTGDIYIQCVTIDETLPEFEPTFINMDIEGAELAALQGAENVIRQNRPDLAICVYHAVNHLWEIPTYINSLNLGYQFYLRNYTGFISETVLYAISGPTEARDPEVTDKVSSDVKEAFL
mgnify:CR=1 FL=1